MEKRPLLFSGLFFILGAAAFFSLPIVCAAERARLLESEPYFQAPVFSASGVLRLRNDAYGKGYFGASRNRGRKHRGIDILAPIGEPVLAAKSGRTAFSGDGKGYGDLIEIVHSDGLRTRYAHLSRREIVEGDWVEKGSVIGRSGRTGNAVNPHIKPHLHFEIRDADHALDPGQSWLDPTLRIQKK